MASVIVASSGTQPCGTPPIVKYYAGSLERLRVQQLPMEVVTLLFLPDEVDKVQAVIEALGKDGAAEAGVRYGARLEEFDRFFEALLRCKEVEGIVNSATAVLRMVEIVEEYLAERATATS